MFLVPFIAHSKMRAFITHGGYNGFLEAAFAGVPLVSLPLFGDQFGNTRRMERHGIGVGLEKKELSERTITAALKKVLQDQRLAQFVSIHLSHEVSSTQGWAGL